MLYIKGRIEMRGIRMICRGVVNSEEKDSSDDSVHYISFFDSCSTKRGAFNSESFINSAIGTHGPS